MDNKYFLENLRSTYESLKFFTIEDNFLILNYNGTFKIKLENVVLSNLNPNLFRLAPNEILQVIYVLELLFKANLSENEAKFVESYANKYANLSKEALSSDEFDENHLWCLSIPIYTAYDEAFINNLGSKIIQDTLNKQANAVNNGKSLQPKLVLAKDNLPSLEDDEAMKNFAQAGFATFILIASTIGLTILYIVYFINR